MQGEGPVLLCFSPSLFQHYSLLEAGDLVCFLLLWLRPLASSAFFSFLSFSISAFCLAQTLCAALHSSCFAALQEGGVEEGEEAMWEGKREAVH